MTDPQKSSAARLYGWGARLSAVLVIGGFLSAWSTSAHAQINPFRGYKGPALTKEDLNSGQAAAGKLLTEDKAEVGKSVDWTGPTSGNSGRISVQKAFQRQGMECRGLRSEVRYKKTPASSPRVSTLNVCRLKTGEWKLM